MKYLSTFFQIVAISNYPYPLFFRWLWLTVNAVQSQARERVVNFRTSLLIALSFGEQFNLSSTALEHLPKN